jgi:hypothetical protein
MDGGKDAHRRIPVQAANVNARGLGPEDFPHD